MATLLVIDNDIVLLARLGTQLEEAGYTVYTASEVAVGEELLHQHAPDMLLLEVKTSNETGWALLEQAVPHSPVLVVSAAGREEDVVRGLELGAVDYIAKPYRSNELLTRVRLRLRQHASVLVPAAELPPPVDLPPVEVPEATPLEVTPLEVTPLEVTPLESTPRDDDAPPLEAAPRDDDAPPVPEASSMREDPSVFMSETEEMALLRYGSDDTAPPAAPAEAAPLEGSLGSSLRQARQQRRLTLVQAENDLKIRMWYLQAMEEEKFSLLPRGPMARQMLRTYTEYLGLDVPQAVNEFERLYASSQIEPPTPVFSTPPRRPPRWIVWVLAAGLALALSGTVLYNVDPQGVAAVGSTVQSWGAVLASPLEWFSASEPAAPTATPEPAPTATPDES